MLTVTRRKPPRRLSIALISALAALSVAACANTGVGDPTSADGGTLVVNHAVAPFTLDPAAVCNTPEVGVVSSLYGRLVGRGTEPGPDGTTQAALGVFEPAIAESWIINDDARTYEFKLREELKFRVIGGRHLA